MFAELLNHADLLVSEDLSSLRSISLGSSNVPSELITRLEQAFPAVEVKESYGLTEGNGPLRSPLDGRKTPRGSVGVCAPETEVMLIDDCGLPAAQGELWVRSPYVLKEYVNRPDLNRERLRDGWLRTGDLFRRDPDGFYYFLGRTDDMFVCGGENIYPKEIESLILSHPDVADVVVAPLPHATKGEAPAAAVVTRHGIPLWPQQIQDHCAKHGPPFAIPRAVLVLDAIPLTAAGKPDRQAVRSLLAATFGTLISRNAPAGLRR
jgi:acyl-CoA synthetase (AMP-forming)/AMP-acid ligase II